jgi:ornithine cyclodeaminase/alanine dehydrogenase-like protein (mu-crystallin family)
VTLILGDKDVREIADMPAVVDEMERALLAEARHGGAVLPGRLNLNLGSTLFRVMPAILPAAGVLGLKFFYGTLEDGVRYSVLVSALHGGEVLTVVDAAYLTALRTGGTSGVATRHLARTDARTVGLIGSGLEAQTNLEAVCAVRPIESVRVFSRNPERRAEFARRMSELLQLEVRPAGQPQEAVAGADIVVAATNTGRGGDVALRGAWLEPGQHLVSIGSTATFLREIDQDAFIRADVAVVDAGWGQVAEESGDVVALLADRPDWSPTGSLGEVLTGGVSRTSPSQITLFKSVGTAAQDLIGALAVYRLAAASGVGLEVPDLTQPKAF